MPLERYTHRRGKGRYAFPVVTLQASGGMSFNELAFEELSRPSHVILSYDKDDKLVGLEPSSGNERYSFPVKEWGTTAENRNWAISVRSFYKYYGLDTEVTRRFRTTMQEGILIIDLKNPFDSLKRRVRRPKIEDPDDQPNEQV